MVHFTNDAAKMPQIQAFLEEYGIRDLEQAREICLAHGLDIHKMVKKIQPISFDDAPWAYTAGAAAALTAGVDSASRRPGSWAGGCKASAPRGRWPRSGRWASATATWRP